MSTQENYNFMTESINTQQPKSSTIIVIGDLCVDEYIYGTVDRISPEAPVPVLQITHSEKRCGMAGNVVKNLNAMGVDTISYFSSTQTTKTRYIDSASGQHLLRVDNDFQSAPFDVDTLTVPANTQAIVISDYNKGFVKREVIEYIQDKYHYLPLFIDTKKQDLQYLSDNCYAKINEHEYKRLKTKPKNLIVTRGGKTVLYNEHEFSVPHIPVRDVTGAGDTFLAALSFRYSVTQDIKESIRYAIAASAITVTKLGVYAPLTEEFE